MAKFDEFDLDLQNTKMGDTRGLINVKNSNDINPLSDPSTLISMFCGGGGAYTTSNTCHMIQSINNYE